MSNTRGIYRKAQPVATPERIAWLLSQWGGWVTATELATLLGLRPGSGYLYRRLREAVEKGLVQREIAKLDSGVAAYVFSVQGEELPF